VKVRKYSPGLVTLKEKYAALFLDVFVVA